MDMLIHQAPVGLAFLGCDLRFRRVNAALAQIVGKPEADHEDKVPSDVWPEDLAVRAEAALHKVLADGSPITEPGYPQGHTASWFAVRDPAGEISGVGLVLSEGDPAGEEEIRRSEERYRSLVQGGAQVVWVAGPDGAMNRTRRNGGGSPVSLPRTTSARAGWTRSTPKTASGSSATGASASGPGRYSTTGTGSAPSRARTGITTCGRCRSSGPARSSSGSAPAPT